MNALCINDSWDYDLNMKVSDLFSPPTGPDDDSVTPILDAALAVFADIGPQRATVDDIAKRAHVGRVTIYRKVGKKDEILAAVLLREATRLYQRVREAADTATTFNDRVVNAFATTVIGIRGNPAWNRILQLEPATILESLTVNGSLVLSGAVSATADVLRMPGLEVDEDQLQAIAEILVRVTHSILLTPQIHLPLDTYDEIERFARTYLVGIAAPLSAEAVAPN